jgi:hypothetical protein
VADQAAAQVEVGRQSVQPAADASAALPLPLPLLLRELDALQQALPS